MLAGLNTAAKVRTGRRTTMVESIAAMSMSMSAAKMQMDASMSIAKMAMNDQAVALNGLMDMVDAANISSDGLDHVIDTLA